MTPRRIYLSPPDVNEIERRNLLDAFDSNWISPLGPHVDAFEREFGAAVQMPATVALSSGTAALHLALKAIGIKAGDDVLVSTLTFAATANPVMYLGATPVFIDVSPDTWTMDPQRLADEIERRAKRHALPKAVIPVDLYGQSCDYDPILEVCGKYDIPVIADAAEAVGTTYKGRPAGGFGLCAAFSFNSNKIITTGGGGMLVSHERTFIERVRYLSTQARDPVPHYQHAEVGFNYRMSNLLAAIGRGQLAQLGRKIERRRLINERYRTALSGRAGISFMPEAAYGRSNCWLTCIVIDPSVAGVSREDIWRHLESRLIESRPVWKPMHMQPAFAHCESVGGEVAAGLFEHGLCLPSGSSLTDADQERVIAAMTEMLDRRWFVAAPPAATAATSDVVESPVAHVPAPHGAPQPKALVAVKRTMLKQHRVLAIGSQLIAMALSNYVAILLRFDGAPPPWAMEAFWYTLPWLVAIRALVFLPLGLYQGLWKYSSLHDLERLLVGVGGSSAIFAFFVFSPLGPQSYPRSALMVDAVLLTLMLGGLRMSRRMYNDARRVGSPGGRRILIYGAGSAGEMVARELRLEQNVGYDPVGFIDDDEDKVGRRLHGLKVLGTRRDLMRVVDETKPQEVLVAMPSLDPAALNAIVRELQPTGVAIKTLPSLRQLIGGKEVTSQVRNLAIEDLLPRVPSDLDPTLLRAFIEGQSVMVVGAGGTIGAELCRQLLRLGPEKLIAFERHEPSLHELMGQLRLRNSPVEIVPVIGDAADRASVDAAIARTRPTIVLHAGGYGQAWLSDDNPREALRNNVDAVRVVVEAAVAARVGRVVIASTFKAADPVTLFGATKRLAELEALERRGGGTLVSCIRFGNVLGSRGSVVASFVAQIQNGGPLTLASETVARHFMLLPDVVRLFLHAAAQATDDDLFAIDMGEPVRILDIATNLIRLAGLTPHVDIPIVITGLRQGERNDDMMTSQYESLEATGTPRVWRVRGSRVAGGSAEREALLSGIGA